MATKGVIGVFNSESHILKAARAARVDKGFLKYDTFSPYPIHGMDDAMGLKRSWLPYVCFVAGVTGTLTALALQIGTSAVDWPINIGGKPFVSLPAFIPITFELTVLLGGLCTVGAMFAANGLPNLNKKVLHPDITNDKFVLFVPETEKNYSEKDVMEFLKKHGALEVSSVVE